MNKWKLLLEDDAKLKNLVKKIKQEFIKPELNESKFETDNILWDILQDHLDRMIKWRDVKELLEIVDLDVVRDFVAKDYYTIESAIRFAYINAIGIKLIKLKVFDRASIKIWPIVNNKYEHF